MWVQGLTAGGWLCCAALGLSNQLSNAVDYPLRWRWSNPTPHGGNIVDMAYSPVLDLAVQVAERGQIFTSSDLNLWLPRESKVTSFLQGVTFFGSRIVVVGENGAVLYADEVNDFQPGILVDGPTSDWLVEVAASPTLLVAAGDNGAIYTSANGISWKKQNSGTSAWFLGVAAGAGTFVVVGEAGAVYTSPNGTNWTARTPPTAEDFYRVDHANGMFTAVGTAGATFSSTNNGVTWFPEVSGATNTLQYATTGGPDRLLDGNNEVRLKEDGRWSDQLAQTNGPPAWTYYTALGRPNFFVIAGQSGMIAEGYQISTNAYFWLAPYQSVRNWLWDVIRLPSFYCAAGDFGTIMTSGNGVDWTLELVPPAVTNTTFLGVGGDTNLLLAVGDSGTMIYSPNLVTNVVVTNGTIVVTQELSSLGVLWYKVPSLPTTNTLQGVTIADDGVYVVTGTQGTILTSPDGTNWTVQVSGTTNVLSSVTSWPGGLVAAGDNGTILTSADGIKWNREPAPPTNWLYRVRWLNGVLIAVGQSGTILTSTNGTLWTPRTSGTSFWLNDVCFVGDTWFAIGVKGTVLTSTNLVEWTDRGTLTKKALYGAATDSSQLVLVGVEGSILRSPVVPSMAPVSVLSYDRVLTNGPSPAYNIFLFGGEPDQQFTLDRSTNLTGSAWITGPALEIFDGSGTLYYVETVSGTNLPPIEFYRTTLTP